LGIALHLLSFPYAKAQTSRLEQKKSRISFESLAACFCSKPELFATYEIIIIFSLSPCQEINSPLSRSSMVGLSDSSPAERHL
jgi:hypothetical protein